MVGLNPMAFCSLPLSSSLNFSAIVFALASNIRFVVVHINTKLSVLPSNINQGACCVGNCVVIPPIFTALVIFELSKMSYVGSLNLVATAYLPPSTSLLALNVGFCCNNLKYFFTIAFKAFFASSTNPSCLSFLFVGSVSDVAADIPFSG